MSGYTSAGLLVDRFKEEVGIVWVWVANCRYNSWNVFTVGRRESALVFANSFVSAWDTMPVWQASVRLFSAIHYFGCLILMLQQVDLKQQDNQFKTTLPATLHKWSKQFQLSTVKG